MTLSQGSQNNSPDESHDLFAEVLQSDYFALLNLSRKFDIDLTELTDNYRTLQKVLHPDRHVASTKHAYRLAMQATSHLNMAMDTLKHPLKRAVYLLSLNGIEMAAETDTKMDPEFLMQQLQWRERIDEKENLKGLTEEIEAAYQHGFKLLSEQLAAEHWQQAREQVRQLQFIDKLRDGLLDLR